MEIITGKIKKPFNIIVYGTPGIGKSTFSTQSPDPLFIGADEIDELDSKRLKKAESWAEFEAQVQYLVKLGDKMDFKTLVIDTIDSVEKLLHRHILSQDPKAAGSMAQAHGGYGKAYERAESEMLKLKGYLQQIRDQHGKNILILGHSSKVQATDTILGLQYDTYEMSIHKKAQAAFVDWVSCVLFATYVTHTKSDDNTDKVFAIGIGERVLLTEKRPGFLAKNRYNLPYEMPLEFSEFNKCYEAFYESNDVDPILLYESCVGLMTNVTDETTKENAKKYIEENKTDSSKLIKIQKRLQTLVQA